MSKVTSNLFGIIPTIEATPNANVSLRRVHSMWRTFIAALFPLKATLLTQVRRRRGRVSALKYPSSLGRKERYIALAGQTGKNQLNHALMIIWIHDILHSQIESGVL